ncbi:hypothetical protein ACT4S2_17160 [Kocuria turfanensis]|uniref:hypothetical protein n=1 Tax=Kocuria turfanensis TaxID=388357 RepID=UPI004036ACB4
MGIDTGARINKRGSSAAANTAKPAAAKIRLGASNTSTSFPQRRSTAPGAIPAAATVLTGPRTLSFARAPPENTFRLKEALSGKRREAASDVGLVAAGTTDVREPIKQADDSISQLSALLIFPGGGAHAPGSEH